LLPFTTATATPEPTKAPEPAAAIAPGELLLTGAVEQEVTLPETVLRALKVTKITAEHPKKGEMEFEGVLLSDLFALAKPKPEATTVVVTASDGYSVEIALADILNCPKCLLAFTDETGVYQLVMPDLESSTWVKQGGQDRVQIALSLALRFTRGEPQRRFYQF